ncbi:MAG: cysteine synthase family protein [Candidatus Marinimicrobia bacterium]|nr:cysteine synthase family protein [Candidatus Neomarinimicrobiota bacterium]MBL7030818.1 cysteine synthase family protein [Candidatus Neomarinimicrobiota bacterium]
MNRYANMLESIGNTPIVRLNHIVPENAGDVWVKCEGGNPTGSYKDRMALAMIEGAEARGELTPGMTVVEYTGGSTGSGLAFVCAVKGYDFHVISSNAFAKEKLDTMRAFGANLEVIQSPSGKIDSELINQMIVRAKELAERDDYFFTDQLNNTDIIKGFENMGREILDQMEDPIDAFTCSVGTAGTLMGVSNILLNSEYEPKIVALEPASAPFYSQGKTGGKHHVEGIGLGFDLPLLNSDNYHEARGIDENEARNMANRLAREEGIFAGTSSGLNVVGAIQLAEELGEGKTVVTVAVDTGLKYLNGDLFM